jgi:hypothetical protein
VSFGIRGFALLLERRLSSDRRTNLVFEQVDGIADTWHEGRLNMGSLSCEGVSNRSCWTCLVGYIGSRAVCLSVRASDRSTRSSRRGTWRAHNVEEIRR